MLARWKRVEKDSVVGLTNLQRTDVTRTVGFAALFFVPAMGAVGGATLWVEFANGTFPLTVVIGFAVFLAVFTLGLTWLAGVGLTTYGVAMSDAGLTVFERTIRRRFLLQWTLEWEKMKEAQLTYGRIWLAEGTGPGLRGTYLTLEQARKVLTDLRCPLKGTVPPAVAARLQLGGG